MIREIDIEDFSEATLSAQNQFHVLCDYTRRDIGDGIEEIKWRTRLGGWGINALALTVPVLGSLAVWGVGAMQTATPNWNKVYVTNRNGRWYYLGQSIDEARNESSILAQLREQIRVLESEVVQLRGQIVNLNARVRELEGNLTNLCEELRQVQAQGTRDTARIAELENELREARVQLARTIAQLNEQISRARARATADAAALEQAINENRSNQGVIAGLRELQQQSQEALRAANDQIAQLESTHGAEVRELRSRLERAEGRNGGPDWINGASDRQIANELNLGSMNGSYHRGSNTTVDVMNIVNLPYRQYDMVTVEKLLHASLNS